MSFNYPCVHIRQDVESYAEQPEVAWHSDTVLDTPVLVSPEDNENLCKDSASGGGTSGAKLKWQNPAGADFAILQWANNPSFTGPTLRSKKITGSEEYDLSHPDELRDGEKIHWRVAAYNNSGGASKASESRTLTKECKDQKKGGGGNPGGGGDEVKCEQFGVKMKIDGPRWVMCCDRAMWHLQIAHTCLTATGQPAATLANVVWTIEQNPADPQNTIEQQNEKFCVVRTQCEKSQVFVLRATAFFTSAVGNFSCSTVQKVFVDCRTGLPKYKPWLWLDYGPGINTYIHNDYQSYSMSYHQFSGVDMVSVYGGDPGHPEDSEGDITEMYALGPVQWAEEVDKRAVAWGVTVQIGEEKTLPDRSGTIPDRAGGDPWSKECTINPGPNTAIKPQARVHMPLGCGLHVEKRRVAIDIEDVIGPEGERQGLIKLEDTEGGEGSPPCRIGVYTGCGLEIKDEMVSVYNYDLIGPGLDVYGDCGLQVYFGCGLEIPQPGGKLRVKNDDLAGPGLLPWDECGLQIYYGCGIKLGASGALEFDPEDAAGDGLVPGDNCELKVNVGCGLEISGDQVKVKPADLAGAGLKTGAGCAVDVDTGCGIKIEGDKVALDIDDITGCGLEACSHDSTGCQLQPCINECGGLARVDYCLEVDQETTQQASIFSIDPGSLSLTLSGCYLTFSLTAVEKIFKANCGNVLMGLPVDGASTLVGGTLDISECMPPQIININYYTCGDCEPINCYECLSAHGLI